jgi:hypothetical protein
MILKKPYKDISETMIYLKVQIVESIDFALDVCPKFDTPEKLWFWLKNKLTFESDAPGVEHLRTMQSLARNGWRGDCDCFTITTVACMIVQGWDNINIDLVGRSRSHPVHIYTDIVWNGKRKVLDFTNPSFNFERSGYAYRQRLPVRWRSWSALPILPR